MQVLKAAPRPAREALRPHVEAELASACQNCAADLLVSLPFCSDPTSVAAAAANMLRRALAILQKHELQAQDAAQGAWNAVVALLRKWQLQETGQGSGGQIAELHLALVKLATVQLQCLDDNAPATCAADFLLCHAVHLLAWFWTVASIDGAHCVYDGLSLHASQVSRLLYLA